MRLTRAEQHMLLKAATFVLAGEWPFGPDTEQADQPALESAKDKLIDRLAKDAR